MNNAGPVILVVILKWQIHDKIQYAEEPGCNDKQGCFPFLILIG